MFKILNSFFYAFIARLGVDLIFFDTKHKHIMANIHDTDMKMAEDRM